MERGLLRRCFSQRRSKASQSSVWPVLWSGFLSLLVTLISNRYQRESCRKFTAINAGLDFGRMLATAAHNLEQLELELRTILLGKMAGQVQHQLLSKTFLLLLKLRV